MLFTSQICSKTFPLFKKRAEKPALFIQPIIYVAYFLNGGPHETIHSSQVQGQGPPK